MNLSWVMRSAVLVCHACLAGKAHHSPPPALCPVRICVLTRSSPPSSCSPHASSPTDAMHGSLWMTGRACCGPSRLRPGLTPLRQLRAELHRPKQFFGCAVQVPSCLLTRLTGHSFDPASSGPGPRLAAVSESGAGSAGLA